MSNAANTTAASTTEAAAAEQPRAKKVQAFYSRKNAKGPEVSLWIVNKTKQGSPDIDGHFGGLRVAGYARAGRNGNFVSFIDANAGKGADGKYTQVARGNVVVNGYGIPKLAITMADNAVVWAEVSIKAPLDLLVSMGLDLKVQDEKKAAAAAKRQGQTTQEAVPA